MFTVFNQKFYQADGYTDSFLQKYCHVKVNQTEIRIQEKKNKTNIFLKMPVNLLGAIKSDKMLQQNRMANSEHHQQKRRLQNYNRFNATGSSLVFED